MGEINDPRACGYVHPLLKDESPEVRKEAAKAYGILMDASASSELFDALNDEENSSEVNQSIVDVLGELAQRHEDTIDSILYSTDFFKNKSSLQNKILKNLTLIAAIAPRPFLSFLKSKDEKYRQIALKILKGCGWSPANDSEKALYLLAREDWEGLTEMGDPAVKLILEQMRSFYEVPYGLYGSQKDHFAEVLRSELTRDMIFPALKENAFKTLANIGTPEAVEFILEKIYFQKNNDLVDFSLKAKNALALVQNEESLETLLSSLRRDDEFVRHTAIKIIGKILGKNKKALEILGKKLIILNEVDLKLLIDTLSRYKWEPATVRDKIFYYFIKNKAGKLSELTQIDVDPLTIWSDDSYPLAIRESYYETAIDIGGKKNIDQLKQQSKHRDPYIRSKVIEGLVRMRYPAAHELIDDLLNKLDSRLSSDLSDIEVQALLKVIPKIDYSAAIPTLIRLLKDDNMKFTKEIINTLGEIGGDSTLDPLIKIMNKRERFQDVAYMALIKIGRLEIVESLLDWLLDTKCFQFYSSGKNELDSLASSSKNIFRDYAEPIIYAFRWTISSYNRDRDETGTHYHLDSCIQGTEKLCQICTSISNNLLQKISKRPELAVYWENADFGKQRDIARKELKCRGNPPYDSAAYLVPTNWIIKSVI